MLYLSVTSGFIWIKFQEEILNNTTPKACTDFVVFTLTFSWKIKKQFANANPQ